MILLYVILIYLIGGLIVHYLIFPVKKPDLQSYFEPGMVFQSKLEGFSQRVIRQEGNNLVLELVMEPHAAGPPMHFHKQFDETFSVSQGTLSLIIEGEHKTVPAGQSMTIPKNIPHKPCNKTDAPVVITGTIPLHFAYCLSQLYRQWDDEPAYSRPPRILFQLAVMGDDMDSWPVEKAPPPAVLGMMKFLLAPTARLLGYRYFNERYRPQKA